MFWPLQSNSEFSGVPEDSQVPFSGVWVATSHFPQSGVATSQAPFTFVCTRSCSYSSLFCVRPSSCLLLFVCVGSRNQKGEMLTLSWTWHVVECIKLMIFFTWTRECLNQTFFMLFGLFTCFSGWWSFMKLRGSYTFCFCVRVVLLLFIVVFVCVVLLLFVVISMCASSRS